MFVKDVYCSERIEIVFTFNTNYRLKERVYNIIGEDLKDKKGLIKKIDGVPVEIVEGMVWILVLLEVVVLEPVWKWMLMMQMCQEEEEEEYWWNLTKKEVTKDKVFGKTCHNLPWGPED